MMIDFRESGHFEITGTRTFFRGARKSKGGGTTSIRYDAEPATAELLLRIISSVNQLSIYGAALDWCQELAQQIADHSPSGTGNLLAEVNNDTASKVAPADVSVLTRPPMVASPRKLGAATQRENRKPSRRYSSE